MSIVNDFLDRILVGDECWEWTGSHNEKGYGTLWAGRHIKAHRLSFELFQSPIPAGLHVMHSCDNRGCVNPAHLSLGTNADNLHDAESRGRIRRGERHPNAKFTNDQVLDIYCGTKTTKFLAKLYGVSIRTINKIKDGSSYRSVTGPL